MSMQKLSVTVEPEVAKALKAHLGKRAISQFVNRAIRHELERERLREFLRELEGELGPPDEEVMGAAGAAFDRAKAGLAKVGKAPKRRRR